LLRGVRYCDGGGGRGDQLAVAPPGHFVGVVAVRVAVLVVASLTCDRVMVVSVIESVVSWAQPGCLVPVVVIAVATAGRVPWRSQGWWSCWSWSHSSTLRCMAQHSQLRRVTWLEQEVSAQVWKVWYALVPHSRIPFPFSWSVGGAACVVSVAVCPSWCAWGWAIDDGMAFNDVVVG